MIPLWDMFLMRCNRFLFLAAVGMIAAPLAFGEPICWDNPTENVDGSPLDDLASVRLHFGTSSSVYDTTKTVPTNLPGDTVCVEPTWLSPGTYYVAATAVDADGNESAHSNEVVKVVEAPPDSPYVLQPPTQEGASSEDIVLLIGETGLPVTLVWSGGSGTTEIELLEYGDTVPIMTGSFSSSTQWDFIPPRAGLYFTRMRSCNPTCGQWTDSYDLGFMYYFKLAAPDPGGID